MSAFTQPDQGNAHSPGLVNSLSSNNPFRNRTASPTLPSPRDQAAPPRPVSRNPFLDSSSSNQNMSSPDKSTFPLPPETSSQKSPLTGSAAELFDNLTFDDEKPTPKNDERPTPRNSGSMATPRNSGGMRAPTRSATGDAQPPPYSAVPKSENIRPPGHRPSRSQEEAMRARRAAARPNSKSRDSGLNIFADPGEGGTSISPRKQRPRRNSESSLMERNGRPHDPEEERKRRERRHRERERRHKERSEGKPKKSKLDLIDQLDATSIYGTGLFHHDGPFDACNPHRNRQGSRRAPMQAFPKDSLNNVLGGGGPLNKRANHDTLLMANDEEAFQDYAKGGTTGSSFEPYSNGAARPGPQRSESNIVSATTRVEPIHGEESLGLGTSTFLEGAPASRTAIQRKESETRELPEGGLSRKKSLAQKIRGINNRQYGPGGRVMSPEGALRSPESPMYTPGGSRNEHNPFFNEFTKGDDSGKNITVTEQPGRARAPSDPRAGTAGMGGLERRMTSDGSGGEGKSGGGFLSRVRSLKGGPKRPNDQKPLPEPAAL